MKKSILAYFFHAITSVIFLSCDSGDKPDLKIRKQPGPHMTIKGAGS